ncbi:uncharacterized protein LOC141904716 [Tubulanus polymorphus]|uniref:uncharacterized protein LOC141904716 n=1 Tax=Tubulanus polymorphus TaxID=672921 RepID=UPI003DA2CB9B
MSGKFDVRTTSSLSLLRPEIKPFRVSGIFDIDHQTNRFHWILWNADYETGEKTTFAFDFYGDLANNHYQLTRDQSCINVKNSFYFGMLKGMVKSACYLRDDAEKKENGGFISYNANAMNVFFHAITCRLTKASAKGFLFGAFDFEVIFDGDVSYSKPPATCPNPAIVLLDYSGENLETVVNMFAPFDEVLKMGPQW